MFTFVTLAADPWPWIIVIALLFVIIVYLGSRVRVVSQSTQYVVERLGKYYTTWISGLHFLWPFVDRIRKTYRPNGQPDEIISLKEQVLDFAPQAVITKDNVTMQIDTVVFLQITDSKLYVYGAENPGLLIEHLTATTLRNIIGELELDQTLTSRDLINEKMRNILDEATDPWGIKINRVEVKNIVPPKEIREAMEKQMRAERERRESILIAEGKKASAILEAEGEKMSAILRAEAKKEQSIREAEGQAIAILKVQEATAQGLTLIREAKPDHAVLTIEAYKAMEKIANGTATKIIIPSEMQGIVGLAAGVLEAVKTSEKK
ncbi:MAG: SPFH domain-containing protein [Candidatus Izemoplasmatales bacterium]|jgi:regulator of protease activity HflC (stomatin/prohibitin superfamily)|nr:SPFH/Band 7/PHB domain protein [Candidatus Izemoplasmatales bacterium]MDD3865520.1 SPFH/Band 7/PHB domain protein [Candidatus Izemoplasmatales bacterium]